MLESGGEARRAGVHEQYERARENYRKLLAEQYFQKN
jgi:hypothetical protein